MTLIVKTFTYGLIAERFTVGACLLFSPQLASRLIGASPKSVSGTASLFARMVGARHMAFGYLLARFQRDASVLAPLAFVNASFEVVDALAMGWEKKTHPRETRPSIGMAAGGWVGALLFSALAFAALSQSKDN